jgi:hypothetical protein
MSRQRGYLSTYGRRLRNDIPIFQASDAEIQADLKKLKYTKKVEPPPVELNVKNELPKKRKATVDDDKYVIDCLIDLMNTKPPEIKKKHIEPVEKKNETMNKSIFHNPAWLSYFAYQSQIMKSMMNITQLGYINSPVPTSITSTADKHIKAARFIQRHKELGKSNRNT